MSTHSAVVPASGWAGTQRSRRQIPVWAVVVGILALAGTAGWGIFQINNLASESARAELTLARIDVQLRHLTEIEQQLALGNVLSPAEEIQRMDSYVALFSDLTGSQTGARLRSVWSQYRSNLQELADLIADGQTGAARAWDASATRPDGEVLTTTIQNAFIDIRAQTDDLRRYAAIGTFVAIGIAAAFISALFLTIERQRSGAMAALEAQERRFRTLAQHGKDLVTVLDRDAVVKYQSPSIQGVLERSSESVVGKSFNELLHPEERNVIDKVIEQAIRKGGEPARTELRLGTASGTWRSFEAIAVNLLNDPSIGGVVVTSRDVTERRQLSERLQHLAFHDSLTGLPNRALFMTHLEKALARASRRVVPVSVLFLDLDGFKAINDTHGHEAGDIVLKSVADRLLRTVRPGDTVARLGGDEFTIVLEDASDDAAVIVANRIAERMVEPISIGDTHVSINTSVGITLSRSPEDQPEGLLRQADAAMYQAKQAGKGRYALYHETQFAGVGMTGENG